MENSYENGKEGCDKLMEKYDFDSPIEVTLVIEEEDPPEPVLLTDLNANIKNVSNAIAYQNSQSISVFKTVIPEGYYEEIQDVKWKLLDAVADNLIHITKCYYNSFINYKKQTTDVEKLKLEYLTFKHYFFDLSYSTTIAILLPQETNILFLNNFIHRIIKIANRSSWFQISYKMLDKLIRDMFTWTKRKKSNLDLKFGSYNHVKEDMNCSFNALPISNRLKQSTRNFNKSFYSGPVTNQATQETNTQSDIVSATHLPMQILNISPNISHINSYSTQELTSPHNMSTKYYEATCNPTGGHIKNNAKPKRTEKYHSISSETFHSQPVINISPSFGQKSNHGTSSPMSIDRRINNLMQGITAMPFSLLGSRINYSTETNNFSSHQTLNTNNSKILLSSGPPNQEIIISVDSNILANINYQNTNQLNNNAVECHVNEAYGINSFKRRKTIDSYSNSLSHHNDNNFHYNKNNSSTTNLKVRDDPCYENSRRAGYELFHTDTLRSSISRDSGCDSPNNGSFRNEQMIETPNNEEQDTPIISHVTSMNPNAVHLNIGFCKVCDATTNNMCIGCYQEYYCSFSCQAKDWENHSNICGTYR